MLKPIKTDKKTKKKRRKKKERKGEQASLTTGKTLRQERRLETAEEQIKILEIQHEIVKGIVDGSEVVLIALHLERYGGQRLNDAWFWLLPDLHQLDEYAEAPDADTYIWGGYGAHSEDVERYVRDRAQWYLPIVEEELEAARSTIEELKQRHW